MSKENLKQMPEEGIPKGHFVPSMCLSAADPGSSALNCESGFVSLTLSMELKLDSPVPYCYQVVAAMRRGMEVR